MSKFIIYLPEYEYSEEPDDPNGADGYGISILSSDIIDCVNVQYKEEENHYTASIYFNKDLEAYENPTVFWFANKEKLDKYLQQFS